MIPRLRALAPLVALLALGAVSTTSSADTVVRRPFLHRYFAHAMGGLDGYSYLNCKECLEQNYARGFRIFEADFWSTTDGHMVVANDGVLWQGLTTSFTLAQFEATKILGKYTPVTIATLAYLLKQFPDVMVMTDIKSDNVTGIDGICSELATHGIDCHVRLIPQIYGYSELAPFKARGFDRVILTLYRFGPTPQEVVTFAAANPEVAAIVIPDVRVTDATWPSALAAVGVPVYVNTINDRSRADVLWGLGVTGLFTAVLFLPEEPPPFPPEFPPPATIVGDAGVPAPQGDGAVPDAGTSTESPDAGSVGFSDLPAAQGTSLPSGCTAWGGGSSLAALLTLVTLLRSRRNARRP